MGRLLRAALGAVVPLVALLALAAGCGGGGESDRDALVGAVTERFIADGYDVTESVGFYGAADDYALLVARDAAGEQQFAVHVTLSDEAAERNLPGAGYREVEGDIIWDTLFKDRNPPYFTAYTRVSDRLMLSRVYDTQEVDADWGQLTRAVREIDAAQ
jgi:hypothetical protein